VSLQRKESSSVQQPLAITLGGWCFGGFVFGFVFGVCVRGGGWGWDLCGVGACLIKALIRVRWYGLPRYLALPNVANRRPRQPAHTHVSQPRRTPRQAAPIRRRKRGGHRRWVLQLVVVCGAAGERQEERLLAALGQALEQRLGLPAAEGLQEGDDPVVPRANWCRIGVVIGVVVAMRI